MPTTKAPPNRDADIPSRAIPPRKGESIESPVTPEGDPERGKGERARNTPLPEEESYERAPGRDAVF